jgi:tRNA A-37 threonylcarbamoyl transferase component Bud32
MAVRLEPALPPLLTAESVIPYLRRRQLLDVGAEAIARPLGGGVSNIVLEVVSDQRSLVVKQSLPKLRVALEWLAKRERIVTEGQALRWAAGLTPGAVPEVLDMDAGSYTMVIERAPDSWVDWKARLLAGDADPNVAAQLGTNLAAWHEASRDDAEISAAFDDAEAFEQLRVDPYYRAIMPKHPALAPEIAGYIDRMQATHRCLVHGDFSPKNVLLGESGLWVVDFEVAHMGDPAFDLAFMHNHLLLKAIHRPEQINGYADCAHAFWRAYRHGVGDGFGGPTAYVFGHVGCLMLARVDGKSPAEYLTPEGQRWARTLGASILNSPPTVLEDAWSRLRAVLPA